MKQSAAGEHTTDAGVRIVDLNRDGLADVLWKGPYPWDPSFGYASATKGVLLNRGGGNGAPHS